MYRFSKEALDDDTYHKHNHRSGLLAHPRDWYETFGFTQPAKWSYMSGSKNTKSTMDLYPHYTFDDGWKWISKDRHMFFISYYSGGVGETSTS